MFKRWIVLFRNMSYNFDGMCIQIEFMKICLLTPLQLFEKEQSIAYIYIFKTFPALHFNFF